MSRDAYPVRSLWFIHIYHEVLQSEAPYIAKLVQMTPTTRVNGIYYCSLGVFIDQLV